MRTCGVCRKAPRADESLRHVQTHGSLLDAPAHQFLVAAWGAVPDETIGAAACESCYARLSGTEPAPPRTYPWPQPVPRRPNSDGDIDVCGVCRRAMYEDDEPRHIRLHADDLQDGLWQAYRDATTEAREAAEEQLLAAQLEHAGLTAPHALARDGRFYQANEQHRQQLEQIFLDHDAPDIVAALQQRAQDAHRDRLNAIDGEFRAATAAADAVLQGELLRIGAAYRRAGILAWRQIEADHRGEPSVEPGGYNACRECVGKYRPRIAERLKRQGIVPAHVPAEQVQGDMLM